MSKEVLKVTDLKDMLNKQENFMGIDQDIK